MWYLLHLWLLWQFEFLWQRTTGMWFTQTFIAIYIFGCKQCINAGKRVQLNEKEIWQTLMDLNFPKRSAFNLIIHLSYSIEQKCLRIPFSTWENGKIKKNVTTVWTSEEVCIQQKEEHSQRIKKITNMFHIQIFDKQINACQVYYMYCTT